MKNLLIRTVLFALTLSAGLLTAQVPQLISYQGRVGVDGVNFDGSGQFKFAFVNAAGTTTYWSNDGSSTAGSEPGTAITIPVSKGLYAVLLGDATLQHMSIVPATVFTHGDVHLRVWFSDGVNGFQQLTPDRRIAAVGYAMMADSVSDGAITTAKIADGAVTSAKLAAGVVQTANLAAGAVGNAQLANSAVTINAGTGLGGGGLVSLGGAVSLSNAGVLSLTGGGGITVDAATGAITLGSSATSAGTAGAIVARDASGGFSAGTITAALNGNAATATTATDFTGMLAGDVTGTQAATAIAATTVTGKALTGFTSASGTLTASDTLLSAISKLDGNTALKAPLASPTFTGSVTLPAGSTTAAPLLLQTGTSLTTPTFGALEFDGTNLFVTNNSVIPTRKTVAFTDSTVTTAQIEAGSVTTDKLATGAVGSAQLATGLTLGGTTTGTFSGNLTGNVTGNVSGSAASFTGSLAGDVTGTQPATVVSTVGGVTSTSLAAGATLANAATNANTSGAIVKRDDSGNFNAGTMTTAGDLNLSATNAAGTVGVINQGGTRLIHSYGSGNFFAGSGAGNFTMTGNGKNTAVGFQALGSNTSGDYNVASGYQTLFSNTSGHSNTAVGFQSLYFNITGAQNTANGLQSLWKNTTGNENAAFGYGALAYNTTGNQNTANGVAALQLNTTGTKNTASGYLALSRNTEGYNNTAIGHEALLNNTTGNNNIAVGLAAGNALTTGSDNIAIGNAGVAGETGIIRIGTAGLHTNTHIAGVIHGDGSELSGVVTKVDRQFVTVGSSTSNSSYQVIASLTTRDIGGPGCYLVNFNCQGSVANGGYQGILVLSINGVDVASTQRSFQNTAIGGGGDSRSFTYLLTSAPEGTVITIKLRSTSNGQGVSVSFGSFSIDGIPQANVQ